MGFKLAAKQKSHHEGLDHVNMADQLLLIAVVQLINLPTTGYKMSVGCLSGTFTSSYIRLCRIQRQV